MHVSGAGDVSRGILGCAPVRTRKIKAAVEDRNVRMRRPAGELGHGHQRLKVLHAWLF